MTERKKLNQKDIPLLDAIVKYNEKKPAYFCIPGHRYEKGINLRFREIVGDAIFSFDLTETPYMDDLHNAEGAIWEAEELAREVFGADDTHFLVNGTTCGNQAMILSTAFEGEKIAIPRNAHKSVLMGLILSGAEPIYLMPEISHETGLLGGITPESVETMFRNHPDCKGVFVVSPTYYGVCSDLKAIAEICHKHNAVLLVDEAHGAHCYFSDLLPKGALEQGADMCAQSIHKVTGSLTQSSMLHVKSKLVDQKCVDANLHLVQSTSPSYLLLISLDAARHDLANQGKVLISKAVELSEYVRTALKSVAGITCVGHEIVGTAGICDLDITRLTISASNLGLSGYQLKDLLFEEYNCDVELADDKNILAIVTFANTKEDMEQLLNALIAISEQYKDGMPITQHGKFPAKPELVLSPRKAYFLEKEDIEWKDAVGRIAGELIAPYPPGIPVVYPGERMSQEVWDFIEEYRISNGHFHGPADSNLDYFKVIREIK
ncbi:aminotransferase class I/II-fold pyridoxal phosphate-dependent enzyme [Anaerovorax sp. IOR16]|uniref:aminotransferase class I/II-fold pyridoxal phosphate-dependent enzyme n=1 Tax=Anaerovorax sp. IOR16 TaxID=2773458 RepID=UPI0019D0C865|nr:aminotransferase class I/II-fold pyridoxal phosphate-dependent enzyme [Anaerovorax sp. IOR16]